MTTRTVAPPACRHRVVSAEPGAELGTCLECRAQVHLGTVEALWREDEPTGDGAPAEAG